MDRIPPETKAIYDLLRADFDKVDRERDDSTTQAIARLNAKLDLLSGRLDEVKVSIGVDLDELRQGLDKPAPPTPPIADPCGAPETLTWVQGNNSSGPEGHCLDSKNRGSAQRVYVPPPIRGTWT
ncbi:uncharacterized protein LOC125513375 isoform X2 [Triticum urartu]|uniref:uncharacterized protein LOC125513375 isoform X2 n=1 Tax=Triticum urartu TaxID=4572 RepID=UPI0020444F47|nr:uncharacterized protein LOC125513375 isoform X2 [Triticum urartu]